MDSDQGKLFVGGISWETNEDRLNEYFSNYGEVLQTIVMRDKATGRPRGFGFVVFADPSIPDRVLQDKHQIDGREVDVKRAMSREEQGSGRSGSLNTSRNFGGGGNIRTKKIFVGGLPSALSDEAFRQYFEGYGNVTDVVIMIDQNTQRPRGFGFISFDSEDAVDRVLHKTFHDLNGKQVEVKRALPKDANPGGSMRSMGGNASGGYPNYGGSGGNGSSYETRVDSNRYTQPQNTGSGFPPYGSSGYGTTGYGYGSNGVGYGGYGGFAGTGAGYGGPAGAAYGNPNVPAAAYGSAPRSSWGTQGATGYGSLGYGSAAPTGYGGPGSAPTGQSPGWSAGYVSQGYGGGYGGSDSSYGNQSMYGAVGGRPGPNNGGGGELQGSDIGSGGYTVGSGYADGAWKSDPSQGYGRHAQQQ